MNKAERLCYFMIRIQFIEEEGGKEEKMHPLDAMHLGINVRFLLFMRLILIHVFCVCVCS